MDVNERIEKALDDLMWCDYEEEREVLRALVRDVLAPLMYDMGRGEMAIEALIRGCAQAREQYGMGMVWDTKGPLPEMLATIRALLPPETR